MATTSPGTNDLVSLLAQGPTEPAKLQRAYQAPLSTQLLLTVWKMVGQPRRHSQAVLDSRTQSYSLMSHVHQIAVEQESNLQQTLP